MRKLLREIQRVKRRIIDPIRALLERARDRLCSRRRRRGGREREITGFEQLLLGLLGVTMQDCIKRRRIPVEVSGGVKKALGLGQVGVIVITA
jgi:hypothetical protein